MERQTVSPQDSPADTSGIFIIRDPQIDVEALMEQVRQNVARRRAEGAYQEDLDAIADQVRLQVLESGVVTAPGHGSVGAAGLLAELEARWLVREVPFTSNVPVIGPVIVAVRKAWNWMSAKWYVRAILEQQVTFNALIVRVLVDTTTSNEILATSLADLQTRCNELEAQLQLLREPGAQPGVMVPDPRSDPE